AMFWAVVELLQLGLVHIENRRLLPALSCWRLAAFCTFGLLLLKPAALVGAWLEGAGWLPTCLVLSASALFLTTSAGAFFGLGELVFSSALHQLETQPAAVRAGGQR